MILGLIPDDAADDGRGTATWLTLDRGPGDDGPGRDDADLGDAGLAAATWHAATATITAIAIAAIAAPPRRSRRDLLEPGSTESPTMNSRSIIT